MLLGLASCSNTPSATDAATDAGSPDATTDAATDAATDAGANDAAMDSGPPPLPAIPSRISDAEATAGREGCGYARGAMPWETVGESAPLGDAIPVDHIFLLMLENRSFDHYFGSMEGVDGFPVDAMNPDASGASVTPFHMDALCNGDVAHSWNASHKQYDDGANDGFVTTNDPAGERAMGYYDERELPFYRSLYGTFAMSDHHHCSVLGPTWVNRYYYAGASSFGMITNDPVPTERIGTEPQLIHQRLDDAGVNWLVFDADAPFLFAGFSRYAGRRLRRFRPLDEFYDRVATGDLPPVVWINPAFAGGVDQTAEHPPGDVQLGQELVSQVVHALFDSPLWQHSVLIITYDEHGGFYDHVPPPAACPPGDYPPDLRPGDQPGDFDRLGFRVPLVVVSPYAKAGYVSAHVTDHASILRFIEARYLLPALTTRDANAWPLLDMFDFDAPPFVTPPTLAGASVDDAALAACQLRFPGGGLGDF